MAKKLFNYDLPPGIKSSTALIDGITQGIINTNSLSYTWSYSMFKTMLQNTWFPEEIDFSSDDYSSLLPAEQRMYDLATAQIIFMDSIQVNNISDNVNGWITDPMVNACFVRQAYEEALHSISYAVQVESVSPNTDIIYNLWKTDSKLRAKNEFIGNVYERFGNVSSEDDFSLLRRAKTEFALFKAVGKIEILDYVKESDYELLKTSSSEEEYHKKLIYFRLKSRLYMLIANQCLEGIYFYSAFVAFYCLGRMGKVPGTVKNIKFINRDELMHTTLVSNSIREIIKLHPELMEDQEVLRESKLLITSATELEIDWGCYLTNNEIFGIDNNSLTKYIKFLAEDRVRMMGMKQYLGELYSADEISELKWVSSYKDINETKTDFFSGDNAGYTIGLDTSDI